MQMVPSQGPRMPQNAVTQVPTYSEVKSVKVSSQG